MKNEYTYLMKTEVLLKRAFPLPTKLDLNSKVADLFLFML